MKYYSHKWILQRLTAIVLIPLTFWFVYCCILFTTLSRNEIAIFFNSYFNSILFLIMMIAMLFHAKLGCETVNEDYVSSKKFKNFLNILIKIIFYLAIIINFLSIFKFLLT